MDGWLDGMDGCWLVGYLIDWVIDWLRMGLIKIDGWMVGWLGGWMVGWLFDWLVGWLIDWLIDKDRWYLAKQFSWSWDLLLNKQRWPLEIVNSVYKYLDIKKVTQHVIWIHTISLLLHELIHVHSFTQRYSNYIHSLSYSSLTYETRAKWTGFIRRHVQMLSFHWDSYHCSLILMFISASSIEKSDLGWCNDLLSDGPKAILCANDNAICYHMDVPLGLSVLRK